MNEIEIWYNGTRFNAGDTVPMSYIEAASFASPIVKQKVPTNFRYEPVGGFKKKKSLKVLWDNPGIRIAIITPFLLAFLIILEQYGLLPYQR